jgi:ADP-ribose pyrophosphatase
VDVRSARPRVWRTSAFVGLARRPRQSAQAALRELREEAGYSSPRVERMATLYPNPATQKNRMHVLLLRDCVRVGAPQLDAGEDLELVLRPVHTLREAVRNGEFPQALQCACLMFALDRLGL